MRNIGWNTTQADFRTYMEKFGDVKYAVLCRAQGDEEKADGEEAATHKGTGFVRFKNKPDADSLLELSQKVETQLDSERAFDKVNKVGVDNKKKKVDDITEQIMGSGSLLKGELELNGRRLVVMPSVKKENVGAAMQANLEAKNKAAAGGMDKRNMYLRKEGLLNETLWIH